VGRGGDHRGGAGGERSARRWGEGDALQTPLHRRRTDLRPPDRARALGGRAAAGQPAARRAGDLDSGRAGAGAGAGAHLPRSARVPRPDPARAGAG
jgi:hypothetical protein